MEGVYAFFTKQCLHKSSLHPQSGTPAGGAATDTLEAGAISNHGELLAFRTRISFIPFDFSGLDFRQGERLAHDLNLTRKPMSIPMAISLASIPANRKVFRDYG